MACAIVRRAVHLEVTGLDNVPEHGPAILVARHYHHLYDAAASLANARLQGADLEGTVLEGADLNFARYDEQTRWPRGFSPRAHGARPGR